MNHPNLSKEINEALSQSERDGGVYVKDIPVGDVIFIKTQNTLYSLRRVDWDTCEIYGNKRYCPFPTKCVVYGSTWGGSMIKVNFIGIGMHLEVGLLEEKTCKTVTTSKIEKVFVVNGLKQ